MLLPETSRPAKSSLLTMAQTISKAESNKASYFSTSGLCAQTWKRTLKNFPKIRMSAEKVIKAQKTWLGPDRLLSFLAIALGGLLSFQYYQSTQVALQFQGLEQSIIALNTKITGLDSLIKDLADKITENDWQSQDDEPLSQNRLLENGVYDIEGHSPHARYLKNIETSPNDSRIPAEPDREYTYDDFLTVFEVEPLFKSVANEQVAELLKNHNVTNDAYFETWAEHISGLHDKYDGILSNGSFDKRDRELMVVKWVSQYEGFGVFALKDIKEGELVGEYTGEIVQDPENSDYAWRYMTNEVDEEEVYLVVDSLKRGNYLRFINHKGENRNTYVDYINLNNTWR